MPWSGDVSRQIWSEKNLEEYKEELKSRDPTNVEFSWIPEFWATTHKLFLINPVGTVEQNLEMINLIICYKRYMPEESLLKCVFHYTSPIFRVEYMAEIEPSSANFQYRCLDLIEEILKRKDSNLLRKLYPYINLSMYENQKRSIEALLREP